MPKLQRPDRGYLLCYSKSFSISVDVDFLLFNWSYQIKNKQKLQYCSLGCESKSWTSAASPSPTPPSPPVHPPLGSIYWALLGAWNRSFPGLALGCFGNYTWETAWSQNKNLHLHQCPIKTSWNFAVGWNARSCLVRLQQHCLLVPATGNHTMFQHFLANRCLFCFLAYSDYADVIQLKCKLTRPAIGVDSLFTLLIIPGFNWLIRLRVKTISKQITKYSSHKR